VTRKEIAAIKALAESGRRLTDDALENQMRINAGLKPYQYGEKTPQKKSVPYSAPTGEYAELGNNVVICADSTAHGFEKKVLQSVPDIIVYDPPYEEVGIYSYVPRYTPGQALLLFWDMARAGSAYQAAFYAGWPFRFELFWDCQGVAFRNDKEPHWAHKACGVFGSRWEWSNARASQFMPEQADGKRRQFSSVYKQQKHRLASWHPHAKPVEWIAAIIAGTQAGTFVYDPFLGGGSSLHAANLIGGRCVGIEIKSDYMEKIIDEHTNG